MANILKHDFFNPYTVLNYSGSSRINTKTSDTRKYTITIWLLWFNELIYCKNIVSNHLDSERMKKIKKIMKIWLLYTCITIWNPIRDAKPLTYKKWPKIYAIHQNESVGVSGWLYGPAGGCCRAGWRSEYVNWLSACAWLDGGPNHEFKNVEKLPGVTV